jgi:hypothetical protein
MRGEGDGRKFAGPRVAPNCFIKFLDYKIFKQSLNRTEEFCNGWRKGMIFQGQDIGNRHKTKLSRNCLGGTILKVEASSLLCSTA